MKKLLLLTLFTGYLFAQPKITTFTTNSNASLRGLCGVSDKVCWASGSAGTVIITIDGGQNWADISPAGYDTLQFRDIHAFNKDTALILSAGLPAVILKTTNGGLSWKIVYRNDKKGVFFDAMDFWDENTGVAFSDAIANHLLILKTEDAGESWYHIDTVTLPKVEYGQGGFAASGTCLKVIGDSSVIIGLGGPKATTLLSVNRGLSWMKGEAPLDSGSPSKGIFSFDFKDGLTGFCVGGDYTGDSATTHSIAKTTDGGKSWQPVNDPAISEHYRSSISYCRNDRWVATSRTGISYTNNDGLKWHKLKGNYYSSSFAGSTLWLSGAGGNMAKLLFQPPVIKKD